MHLPRKYAAIFFKIYDVILIKLVSGLGNQLFQYTIGRQIALLNKVPLKLDISFFDTQSLRSFKLDNYNINADIASADEIDSYLYRYRSNALPAKILRKADKLKPAHRRLLYKQSAWWAYEPEVLKASSNVYLDGYWQNYKYFTNIPEQILSELSVKKAVHSKANLLEDQIIGNDSSVSIHVRRGDYITDEEANKRLGALPLEYYSKSIERIMEKIDNPAYFVFSDDMKWVKNNLPLPASTEFIELEDGKLDHVELDLMSKCRHNIIANSSFSWWGAFLNRNPGKVVIAPKRWVAQESLNQHIQLQFPSWIQL